jgi:hypothetical protein
MAQVAGAALAAAVARWIRAANLLRKSALEAQVVSTGGHEPGLAGDWRAAGLLKVFWWLPLARHFRQSQRFSGPACALEMASNGDVLTMLLLTALVGKQPESAPEIGFFSAPVDRETSVRWRRSASNSMT